MLILGSFFLALIVIGIIGFGILAVKGSAFDKESKTYVDRVVPLILSNLNKETLLQYAGEQLKDSATPKEFEKLFNWISKIGEFKEYKEYKESKGQATISITPKSGKVITGHYEIRADFET